MIHIKLYIKIICKIERVRMLDKITILNGQWYWKLYRGSRTIDLIAVSVVFISGLNSTYKCVF